MPNPYGRNPKPAALHYLHGTARPGRMSKRGKEPQAKAGLPEPPDWLLPEAKAQWARVVEALGATGIYTAADSAALTIFCQGWARYKQAETADPYVPLPASFLSALSAAGSKLGLDPAARTKLGTQAQPAEPESEDPNDPWVTLRRLRREA
jgi:phage terminase small subunit